MQVYLFFCRPADKATLKICVIACIDDLDHWLACNRLKLNPANSEFLMVCYSSSSSSCWQQHVPLRGRWCDPSYYHAQSRCIFWCHLHHGSTCWSTRSHRVLSTASSTSHSSLLTMTTAIQLMNSFVVTSVDYCNSLLTGLPVHQLDRIQSVLNYAVHLVYGRRKYDHMTPHLCGIICTGCVSQRE